MISDKIARSAIRVVDSCQNLEHLRMCRAWITDLNNRGIVSKLLYGKLMSYVYLVSKQPKFQDSVHSDSLEDDLLQE